MNKRPIQITGVFLRRTSNDVVVEIEVHGVWIEVIRERYDGAFSHIVEVAGMRRAIEEAADKQSYGDLAASGGIVDAP